MNFKSYVTEKVIQKKHTWYDDNFKNLSDDEQDKLWDMFLSTYKRLPGGPQYKSQNELERDNIQNDVMVIDVDEDPTEDVFILYKSTKFGNKIISLGTNNNIHAKKAMMDKMIEVLKTAGYYCEASGVLKEILISRDVPIVDSERDVEKVLLKDIHWLNDGGNYMREITGVGVKTKMLMGRPKL